ncbi:MAG: hypothetical protein ACI9W2_000971 [Gammaproteobacteria bacterium]|jgi:hypothetical protein
MSKNTAPSAAGDEVKMIYLIKRRDTTSRDELVAHWFASHMPPVIAAQTRNAALGHPHAARYVVTLFDPDVKQAPLWDGMAALWWNRRPPTPDQPSGTAPTDSFQEKAQPYTPWATHEHVIIDGAQHLPVNPLTLNPPFPCTRSGLYKVSFLVTVKSDTDYPALFEHWLNVHAPNVRETMIAVGGLRYVVNLSVEPQREAYAGLAELYFPNEQAFENYRRAIKPDGMEGWVERDRMPILVSQTQFIGIP